MTTKEEIRNEYTTHETAGLEFVRDYRAQLGADVSNGVIPEFDATERYSILKPALGFIKEGDWKNANGFLKLMGGSVYCPQEVIDSIIVSVSNYITNNYTF